MSDPRDTSTRKIGRFAEEELLVSNEIQWGGSIFPMEITIEVNPNVAPYMRDGDMIRIVTLPSSGGHGVKAMLLGKVELAKASA